MPGAAVDAPRGRMCAAAAALTLLPLLWLPCARDAGAGGWALPPLVDEAAGLGNGWRVVTLPTQKPPITRYTAERVQGRQVLRVEADASYGNLAYAVPGVDAPRRLTWRWHVPQPNADVDLRHKAGDDSPAKVCLSFDLPMSAVPFVERQLLRLARSRTGENLPAATLCWVWAGTEPHGTRLDNAYTRRVRYIVLRNGQDAPGQWHSESRDVAADFLRAFGDESATVPPLTAVIVAGDADNTGGRSLAHVADLAFAP